MAEHDTTTDGGAYIDGNVGTQGGKFVGRDDGSATGNVLNVNLITDKLPEHKPHPLDRRHISVEVEREIYQNLAVLNEQLIKLTGTVTVNNELTKINIDLLKEQVSQAKTLAEKTQEMVSRGLTGVNVVMPDKPPPPWFWPAFSFFICVLSIACVVIAFELATGGH